MEPASIPDFLHREGPEDRPLLLYVTSSAADRSEKIRSYEESRMGNDRLLVASNAFQCYILDEELLSRDDPLLEILGKHRAPSFAVFSRGKLVLGAGPYASSSELYSMLRRSLIRTCGASLDAMVREGLELQRVLSRIDAEVEELDSLLAQIPEDAEQRETYRKEREALEAERTAYLAREEALFDLSNK